MGILNKFQINLFVVILLFGLVSTVNGCSGNSYVREVSNYSFGDDDDKLLNDFTITTSPGQTLRVKSDAGSVKIKVGSSDSRVTVKVYGNDETNTRVNYTATGTSDGVEVTAKVKEEYKNNNDGWNFRLRFEIEVPSTYNIRVSTGGGAVSVANTNGTLDINTGGGAISVDNTTGNLDINTGGGAVKITENTGDIDINTGGGAVKLNGFNGNVEVNTGGGSVSMNGSNGSINVTTGGGSISLEYTGANYGIDLNTGAGSISLDIPSNISADINLTTGMGSISSDFGKAEKNGMGSSLRTTINGGGEKIECHTSVGSIRVSSN